MCPHEGAVQRSVSSSTSSKVVRANNNTVSDEGSFNWHLSGQRLNGAEWTLLFGLIRNAITAKE